MTRKRFVKLLMAKGYDRNEANQIANTGKKGQPYAERYIAIVVMLAVPETFDHLRKLLREALQQITETAKAAAQSLVNAVQRINESSPAIIENMRRLQAADEGKPL